VPASWIHDPSQWSHWLRWIQLSRPRTSLLQILPDDCACVMNDGFWDAVDVDEVIINVDVGGWWECYCIIGGDARYSTVVRIEYHLQRWLACVGLWLSLLGSLLMAVSAGPPGFLYIICLYGSLILLHTVFCGMIKILVILID